MDKFERNFFNHELIDLNNLPKNQRLDRIINGYIVVILATLKNIVVL